MLKRFVFGLSLLFLVGCNVSASVLDDDMIDFETIAESTYHLQQKTMPTLYHLDTLPNINIAAKAAILTNGKTGEVLYGQNVHESLPIASMSKIMSMVLVLEAIETGKIHWDDQVTISNYAYKISNHPGYSSVYLREDSTYTIEDLFQAMVIRSANGATIALAEAVHVTEERFVEQMNEKAAQLGLMNTSFVNSTGLTNKSLLGYHFLGSEEDSNKMSAYDLTLLTNHIIERFPELLEITQQPTFDFEGNTYHSTNFMLENPDLHINEATYPGVLGLKTGYTGDAGHGFTGIVQIEDRQFVSVIIGHEDGMQRFLDTKMLYEFVAEQIR